MPFVDLKNKCVPLNSYSSSNHPLYFMSGISHQCLWSLQVCVPSLELFFFSFVLFLQASRKQQTSVFSQGAVVGRVKLWHSHSFYISRLESVLLNRPSQDALKVTFVAEAFLHYFSGELPRAQLRNVNKPHGSQRLEILVKDSPTR